MNLKLCNNLMIGHLDGYEKQLFAIWYHNYVVALFFPWKPHSVFDNEIRLLWILPNDKKTGLQ